MSQPRQRVMSKRIPVGDLRGTDYVEAGTCDSLLVSQGHARSKNGAWSGGGPFYQVSEKVQHLGERVFPGYENWMGKWWPCQAVGVTGITTRLPKPSLASYMENWKTLEAASWAFVPSGFRKTRPGNPIASLGQFIVELRDLPKLPFQGRKSYVSVWKMGLSLPNIMHHLRSYASDFRHLGGEYLNVVFGWKPFIRDLQQAYNLWKTIDKRMAQIVKDNGKGIRRRATVSSTSSNSPPDTAHWPYTGVGVSGFPGYLSYGNGGSSDYAAVTSTTEKVWYAARYRYFIPDVSSSQWTRKARLALFGALPTPELIWAVTPWSWLIDWAVNVSDVMSNMSANAVENLVQDYSFTMRMVETRKFATTSCTWGSSPNGYFGAGSATWQSSYTQTIKTRSWGGSPYALTAVAGQPLTAYQGGVLAALGLSLAK